MKLRRPLRCDVIISSASIHRRLRPVLRTIVAHHFCNAQAVVGEHAALADGLRLAMLKMPAPFEAGRPMGSALYFMLTPDEPVKLHRIRNDQFYHYYLGDPIEVLMMLEDGSTQHHIVGPDLRKGHKVQLLIPGGTFHTARVIGARRWFLGASTEWPGVEPADVELGNADALAAKYPTVAAQIRSFPVPAKP